MNAPDPKEAWERLLDRKRKRIDKYIRDSNPPLDKFVPESFSKDLWKRDDVLKFYPSYSRSQVLNVLQNYAVVLTILTKIVWPFDSSLFQKYFLDIEHGQRTDQYLPFTSDLSFLGSYEYQFRETQMMFKPCVIMTGLMSVTSYPANRPLPFEELESISQGTGGEIYKVKIAPKYLVTPEHWSNQNSEVYAYKKFKRIADPEIDNHSYLRLSIADHPHVQLHTAAISHGDDLCIFLPWTPLGDLEVLLHGGRDPAPVTTSLGTTKYDFAQVFPDVHASDFIVQLWRLASALKYLHHDLILSESAQHFFCAHNDLRPRNILVYREPGHPVGKWVISDFGISSFGSDLDESNNLPRHFIYRTVGQFARREGMHFAPELNPKSSRDPDPRECDVWSLGCILSDVLAFVFGGLDCTSSANAVPKAVRSFREFRNRKDTGEDYFYRYATDRSLRGKLAQVVEVRPEVCRWLDELDSDARVNPKRRWIRNLTDLIRDILVVDPASRISAKDVHSQLEDTTRMMQSQEFGMSPRSPLSPASRSKAVFVGQFARPESSTSLETDTTAPSTVIDSPDQIESPPQSPAQSPLRLMSRADENELLSRAQPIHAREAPISPASSKDTASQDRVHRSGSSGHQNSLRSTDTDTSLQAPYTVSNQYSNRPLVHVHQLFRDRVARCYAISPTADKIAYLLHESGRLKRWYVKVFDTDTRSGGVSLPALPERILWDNNWTNLRIASKHVAISGYNQHNVRESFWICVGMSAWQSLSCTPELPPKDRRSCDIVPSVQGRYALISNNIIHLRDPNFPQSQRRLERPGFRLGASCFTGSGDFFISWWWMASGNNKDTILHEIIFWDIRSASSKIARYKFDLDAKRSSDKWSLIPSGSQSACVFSLEPKERYYLEAAWDNSRMKAISIPNLPIFDSTVTAWEDTWCVSAVPKPRSLIKGKLRYNYEIRESHYKVENQTFYSEAECDVPHTLAHKDYQIAVKGEEGQDLPRTVVLASVSGELIVGELPPRANEAEETTHRLGSQSHDFAAAAGLGFGGLAL